MMNITKYLAKICFAVVLSALVLQSCGEDSALIEETEDIQSTSKEWLTQDAIGGTFLMEDENTMQHYFEMQRDENYYSPSWSSFLGINTRMTHTEYCYQSYRSVYWYDFSLSLTANADPFGDRMHVLLQDVSFSYDLGVETIVDVSFSAGIKSKGMGEDGYDEYEKIYSTVSKEYNVMLSGVSYDELLHFSLKDFSSTWLPFTIIEIYIAKSIGLVQFQLNNGLVYRRI